MLKHFPPNIVPEEKGLGGAVDQMAEAGLSDTQAIDKDKSVLCRQPATSDEHVLTKPASARMTTLQLPDDDGLHDDSTSSGTDETDSDIFDDLVVSSEGHVSPTGETHLQAIRIGSFPHESVLQEIIDEERDELGVCDSAVPDVEVMTTSTEESDEAVSQQDDADSALDAEKRNWRPLPTWPQTSRSVYKTL